MIKFKHYCNSGDLIAALAGIRQVCKDLGQKAEIYQQLNVPADYYPGAVHPVQKEGLMVNMNKSTFEMIKPLVLSQPYIGGFKEYAGQKITVDLDVIRSKCFVNMPFGMLPSWPMLAYPDMAADLSEPWLSAKPATTSNGFVILNFTERYRNPTISYFFLKKYKNLLFAGTEKEHAMFCEQWKLKIPYLRVENFLELAQCIRGSLFFSGNQSMNWNIANAMGHPRILEMSSMAPNCQPFVGKKNYGYYHQGAAEYYFEKLMKQNA